MKTIFEIYHSRDSFGSGEYALEGCRSNKACAAEAREVLMVVTVLVSTSEQV